MKLRILTALALNLFSVSAAAQLARSIDFSESAGAVTLTHDGAEVTLQPIADPDDEYAIDVHISIRIPGYQSIIVPEGGGTSAYFKRWVGIGKLAASDAAPSVILEGFTGGAHCCATLRVVIPAGRQLKVIEFEAIDGAGDATFPKDVDGDGITDFVRQDDRFRYQFASGAGSLSPPLIFNIYKGNLVDVTSEPGFVPIWMKYAADARALCADRANPDRNGACAAYVAAAARLGKFAPAMKEAEMLAATGKDIELPISCRVAEVNGLCPAGMERKFFSFSDALRWFLRDTGYIS